MARLAGKKNWGRGLKLLAEGAVLDLRRSGRLIESRVANASGTFELVRLSFIKERVACRCSCRQPGELCDHGVASLLLLLEDEPEILDFLERHEEPSPATAPSAGKEEAGAAPPSEAPSSQASRGPRQESLGSLFGKSESAAQVELMIVGPLTTMESRWRKARIEASIRHRGKNYSGTNMKRLVELGHAAGDMRLSDFSPQEQQIMRFLVREADMVGTAFQATAYDMSDFLHTATGFERLTTNGGQVRVHAQRADLVFTVKSKASGGLVTPGLRLPGRGLLPRAHVTHIAGRGGYWLGVDREFWWLPGVIPSPWLRFFLKGEPAELTRTQLKELEELCTSAAFPAELVPAESALELVSRTGRCKPVICLDWRHKRISATLEFDYDGQRVRGPTPVILWERRRFVTRDDNAEKGSNRSLISAGFTSRREAANVRYTMEAPEKIASFLDTELPRLGKSWLVYWTPDFSALRQRSGTMRMTIRQGQETPSWFDLECSLTDAAGEPILWDDIRRPVIKGQQVVLLPSGAVVQITTKRQRLLRLLMRRAIEHEGNRFRFGIYSALPLGEALSPYLVGVAARWLTLRERLLHPEHRPMVDLPGQMCDRLRGYQNEGVAWLRLLEECGFHGILADEMGLGKTVQALSIMAATRFPDGSAGPRPSLVVCPTSLVENWAVEAERFFPVMRTVTVRGSDRQSIISRAESHDLLITSYALLRRDIADYGSIDLNYLVLDEAQHIKNPLTVNAKTCKALQARHRLILTGTPIENSLIEIWSLFDFLLPGFLGSRQEFREEYETEDNLRESRVRTLAAHIRPFILRRTKTQVLQELPPKIEQVVYCELAPEQRLLYDRMHRHGQEMLYELRQGGWKDRRFELLSVLLRLRQICCHPALLPQEIQDASKLKGAPSAKEELAREIILQALDDQHRVLFFSQFVGVLSLFRPWLEEMGIRYEYLDGSTRDRQQRVDRFNSDPSIPVFLLSLKAGGTGLNLTGADTVLHYDQWWNPMVEDQATDRTHRIGQKRPVTALKLVARHTIEERVLALQESKRELFDQLLSGAPTKLGELTTEDLEFLLLRGEEDSAREAAGQ